MKKRCWLMSEDEMKDIRNPRTMNLSTLLHFGAEYTVFPALLIPLIRNWNNPHMKETLVYLSGTLFINAICQPLSFYTKAKAMTSEANYDLAKREAHSYNILRKMKGMGLPALVERSLAHLHLYFARKYGERAASAARETRR